MPWRSRISNVAGLMTTSVSTRNGVSPSRQPPAKIGGSASVCVTLSVASPQYRVRVVSSDDGITYHAGSGSKGTPLDSAQRRHQAAARRAGWARFASFPS